jgi:DNA-binding NarL/FixJ family response regulator
MDAYVSKPIRTSELFETIERTLERYRELKPAMDKSIYRPRSESLEAGLSTMVPCRATGKPKETELLLVC